MKGHIIVASTGSGIAGKPRPFVIVQDDRFDFPDTVIVVPLTTENVTDSSVRPLIKPDLANGLKYPSCAMTNRIIAIKKVRVQGSVGVLSMDDMTRIDAALTSILGLDRS